MVEHGRTNTLGTLGIDFKKRHDPILIRNKDYQNNRNGIPELWVMQILYMVAVHTTT